MIRKLRTLFGAGSSTPDDGLAFGDDALTPGASKSGLSTDDWTWERADEYPYDHYTDAREDLERLERDGAHELAEELGLWCIDFVEAEAEWERDQGYEFAEIAPAYYRHLAVVYREEGRYGAEVAILERYLRACAAVDDAPDDGLVRRLERARALASR